MAESRTRLLGVIGAHPDRGPNVVTLNLGIALAQLGKRTTIADFGTSDLRRMLGLFRKVEGLREFANSERRSIAPFVCPAPVPNLWIVGPGNRTNGTTPFAYPWEKKARLIRALAAIEGDFVLADLGTELTGHAADFFSMTNAGIVVLSADPSEVLRSYEFLKSAIYRIIRRRLGSDSETAALLAQLEHAGNSARTPTIAHITGLVRHRDPDEAQVIEEICEQFASLLIINAGQSLQDMELGDKLRVICRRYLSIRVEYLGFLYEEAAVDRAHGTTDPIVIRQPNSRAAVAMHRIAHKCMQSRALANVQLDPDLLAARPERLAASRAESAEAGDVGGMIETLLAGTVQRDIGEVERHLSRAQRKLEGRPRIKARKPETKDKAPEPAKNLAKSPEARTRRILKTAFNPADLRALEALIDSLDEDYFPDEKWKWKVRALSTPDRVVHHLISRGIRRDFFYREAPKGAPQKNPA